jgi:hypothetical protein
MRPGTLKPTVQFVSAQGLHCSRDRKVPRLELPLLFTPGVLFVSHIKKQTKPAELARFIAFRSCVRARSSKVKQSRLLAIRLAGFELITTYGRF